MLAIRLARFGKKHRPVYRLTVSEKSKDPKSNYLEALGLYDPNEGAKILNLKEERLKHWISQGAQLSPTVNNLLVEQGVISGEKVRKVKIKKAKLAKKEEEKAEKAKTEVKSEEKAEESKEEQKTEEKKEEKVEEVKVEEKKEEASKEEKAAEQTTEESKEEQK